MKLIGATASPYVRKVRVVMAEKLLEFEFATTNVWAGDSDISDVNPLGKVPCLLLPDGFAMVDSRVIVEYLDTLSSSGAMLPEPSRARAEVKTWEALADGALDAAILARLEATWGGRTDEQRSQAWIDRQLGKVTLALHTMSQRLGDRHSYCSGDQLNLSDVAVGCALGWLDFRFPQIDWRAAHPNLARLYGRLIERPSFSSTMPG